VAICIITITLSPDSCAFFLLDLLVIMCLFHLLFHLRVLHGGADAKAMLAIALLLPRYPVFDPLPLITVPQNVLSTIEFAFPFALLVLMDAALATLVVPFANLVRNAVRRELSLPEALFGYKLDIDEAPKHYVWPMERIEDGERALVLFPSRARNYREDLLKLKEAGVSRIWVTPKLPFIVAIFAGFILALAVGNPVLWLMRLLMH